MIPAISLLDAVLLALHTSLMVKTKNGVKDRKGLNENE